MARPRLSPAVLRRFFPAAFVFLLTIYAAATATAAPLYQICGNNGLNYTANSTYESNLNSLLSALAANGSATGYLNSTVGAAPDRVEGLVLCRGDVVPSECRSCLAIAAQDVVQLCQYKKSAVIWYDYCMLRYSNLRFISVPDDTLKVYLRNVQNVTEVTQFGRQRDQLMADLARYAVSNSSARLFSTGDADYGDPGNPKIYGLVQCTRDQSADQCSSCLTGILSETPTVFPRSQGARVIKATCNFRYELYPFFNSSVMVSIPLPTNATSPGPAPLGEKEQENVTGTVLAIAIPLGVVGFLVISVMCVCFLRRKSKEKASYAKDKPEIADSESLLFDLATLRAATNNFSDLNKLGEGGFGSVFKGLLSSGQEIAAKRLSAGSGQGVDELKNEVALLAKLQHRNLVRLLGVCVEGEEKLLVYEFVPNTSLDKFLFDPARTQQLNWETRYKIIGGIARGLQYLHEESQLKIIHRDLKASNILLDADMNAKISDFGLARLFGGDQTQASTTRVVGTYGYMAPEYAMRGQFSNKSDVFSFGVLLLEIVTGRRNSAFSGSGNSVDLLSYVWERWSSGSALEAVDPLLGGQYQRNEVMRCIQIGLQCVEAAPAERPSMSSVVLMLRSVSVSLRVPSKPAFWLGDSGAYSDAFPKGAAGHSPGTAREESTSKSAIYSPNEMSVSELEPR